MKILCLTFLAFTSLSYSCEDDPFDMYARMMGSVPAQIFLDSDEGQLCMLINDHFYVIQKVEHHPDCPCLIPRIEVLPDGTIWIDPND